MIDMHTRPRLGLTAVRRQIDEAVTQALGMDADWVAALRNELAREPSITGSAAGAF